MNIDAVSAKPTGEALKLKPMRIALWDRYGGSMDLRLDPLDLRAGLPDDNRGGVPGDARCR